MGEKKKIHSDDIHTAELIAFKTGLLLILIFIWRKESDHMAVFNSE